MSLALPSVHYSVVLYVPVDFKSPKHAIAIRVTRTMLPIIASLQP